MVKVKSITDAKENYEQASSLVPDRYKKGIENTGDWADKAQSDGAERRYAEGVQKAVSNKTRQKKLRQITNGEWQERALTKGVSTIGSAMRQSSDKWATNSRPFFDALERLNLPERTSDAMANIDARLKPVVKVLQDTKKAQL